MMDRLTRNQLIRYSADERLSPEFREACRRELGDRVGKQAAGAKYVGT
jgi:hypothetical protein